MAKERIAIGALDFGTSRIKLGIYAPLVVPEVRIVGSIENVILKDPNGQVSMSYGRLREQIEPLFVRLAQYLSTHRINTLYLGICGHVSSLFPWDRDKGIPVSDMFPIWMDNTCAHVLPAFKTLLDNGRGPGVMGSFLPWGPNWLLAKLLHQKQSGFPAHQVWVQVGDALFYELCGEWRSHFSSQVSMIHQNDHRYVPEFMEYLGLNSFQLPQIEPVSPVRMKDEVRKKFNFPPSSFVLPALGDFYASFVAMQLENSEGFLLANTSEVAGVFTRSKPELLENFVNLSLDHGFVNYGSTSSGGNLIPWFFARYLREEVSETRLNELTAAATLLHPLDTPVFLPYIQGERAPLWDTRVRESLHELREKHTLVHVFRSLLEGVAFARRQCFEELNNPDVRQIKLAGGSTQNWLWNQVRANILGKKLLVAVEKDLAVVGTIHHQIDAAVLSLEKPRVEFRELYPDHRLQEVYDDKYKRFIHYQQLQLAGL